MKIVILDGYTENPGDLSWNGFEALGEVTVYDRTPFADGSGEIGVISSVTQAFCGDCNRARLSTEGQLYLCLFAHRGHDLRSLLRGGASDDTIRNAIGHIWQGRTDRYSELRGTLGHAGARPRVEMSYIGG